MRTAIEYTMKAVVGLMTILLIVVMGIVWLAPMARSAELPPAVFIVAHQDDEVLSFGPGIQQHIDAGQEVYVILATDGGAAHIPHVDRHLGRDATPAEITLHRDFEFSWTVGVAMGTNWVIAPNRGHDGQLTQTQAGAVIDWARTQYGQDARIKTHSRFDSHPDHAALGRALQADYDANPNLDARFYLAPHKVVQAEQAGHQLPSLSLARRAMPANLLGAYELWAPDFAPNRYWATPSGAVQSLMNKFEADPHVYVHKPE